MVMSNQIKSLSHPATLNMSAVTPPLRNQYLPDTCHQSLVFTTLPKLSYLPDILGKLSSPTTTAISSLTY